FRQQNLKMGQLDAASAHNLRQVKVANADPNGHFERVFGNRDESLEQLLMSHLSDIGADINKMGVKNGKDRQRQTTVINEFILSASPEYFRPGRPEAAGEYDRDRLDAWLQAATEWAKKEFGQHLLAIDLHCDEATPHLHICAAPLVEKTKNLRRTQAEIAEGKPARTATVWAFSNCELNHRETMRQRQTSAARALEHLGLHRGIPSKAKYKTLKKHYREANKPLPNITPNKVSISKFDGSKIKFDNPPEASLLRPSSINAVNQWCRDMLLELNKLKEKLISLSNNRNTIARECNRLNKLAVEIRAQAEMYRRSNEEIRAAQLYVYDKFENDPVALMNYLASTDQNAKEAYLRGVNKGTIMLADEIKKTKDGFAEEKERLEGRIGDLSKENRDLKRDLVIQETKMNEAISEKNKMYNIMKSKNPNYELANNR
ncbi:plasmid recombination protein, partial [Aeromonas media]|uniref:plasmid recombination protein n=1 Tax=Aeromonas media TaxID=651 RepID=UPI0038D065E9